MNAALHLDCRELLQKGLSPSGVVFIAKALKMPTILVAGFPSMPAHTRENIMRGETQVFQDGHGDWQLTHAFAHT